MSIKKKDTLKPIFPPESKRGITKRDVIIWGLALWIGAGTYRVWDNIVNILDEEKEKSRADEQYKKIAINAKVKFESALLKFWIDTRLINNILNSIVLINSWKGIWTGFFIWNKTILTAGHVIWDRVNGAKFDFSQPNMPYSIYDLNWNSYKSISVLWDWNNDLWYIRVSENGKGYLKVSDNKHEDGERITLGFWGTEWHITIWQPAKTFWDEKLWSDALWKIETLTNRIVKWDSWWPVLDKNGTLTWLVIYKYGYDVGPQIKDSETGISFNVDLRYWWVEPISDIQDFLKSTTK